MENAERSLPTVGEIARRLNQPIHKIEYIIRSRGITPATRAGNARVFTESAVAYIAAEMRLPLSNHDRLLNLKRTLSPRDGGAA